LSRLGDVSSHSATPYLLAGWDEQYWITHPSSVQSQWIRRVVAAQIGFDDLWDWGLYSGQDELLATLQRLASDLPLGGGHLDNLV
jgi:hypothetical protein